MSTKRRTSPKKGRTQQLTPPPGLDSLSSRWTVPTADVDFDALAVAFEAQTRSAATIEAYAAGESEGHRWHLQIAVSPANADNSLSDSPDGLTDVALSFRAGALDAPGEYLKATAVLK